MGGMGGAVSVRLDAIKLAVDLEGGIRDVPTCVRRVQTLGRAVLAAQAEKREQEREAKSTP